MQSCRRRSLCTWLLAVTAFSAIGCDATAGFRVNTDALVQTTVVEEMRLLAQFVTRAQMGNAYIVSPLSYVSPTIVGLPCSLPSGAADSNGNGIPDDLTYVFTDTNCPDASHSIRGQVRIQDLGGPWSVRVTYNQLNSTLINTTFSTERIVDGTLELRQLSDTSVQVTNSTTSAERIVGGIAGDVTRRKNNLSFIQYGAVTRDANGFSQPLPRRVSVSGSVNRIGLVFADGDSLSMAVNTTVALSQTVPVCVGFFTTGQLDVRVTGTYSSTVGIRFTC